MSPGIESDIVSALFTRTSTCDYDRLCDLDVLGVAESHLSHDENVFLKFKQQLKRNEEGWYETGLVWNENEAPLKNNKSGSLGRLKSLIKRLEQNPELFESYNQIIKDQLAINVIEKVPESESDNPKEFFMPHRPVIREDAESTKLRVVYDASAKSESGYSLNDCLEKGPSLQNKLWDILIRTRFRPVILCADIQKAFLQIRIREEERESLKFHWIESLTNKSIQTCRFTRLLFGLNQSPFILEGTLRTHFDTYRNMYLELIEKIKDDMYVDDMVTGGDNVREVEKMKSESIELFEKGGFKLHKWHSNEPHLETNDLSPNTELNYAKESLGTKSTETKILGLHWDKQRDTYRVEIPTESQRLTKRNVLKTLASIYDPLGFISPVLLVGKILYRNLCELKIPWDKEIPNDIESKWIKWVKSLNLKVEIPRAITISTGEITFIDIHVFSDASSNGVCSAAYATICQNNNITQGLIASKSRLAKKNLTIPRLELIAAHMSSNLAENIKNALSSQNIRKFTAWSDSTVVLQWLRDLGEYKVFVSNRVAKIRKHDYLDWLYVPTKTNPADIGSRGCELSKLSKMWWSGPEWLVNCEKWPEQPEITKCDESEIERKKVKEILAATIINLEHPVDTLLNKFTLHKTLRILSWVNRFIHNCRKNKISGPLTTEEVLVQKKLLIKREQNKYSETESFRNCKQQLNLKINREGIYECQGRIQGDYPIFIPNKSILAEKLVEEAHLQTIHGGVTLTMAKIREQYWVPTLRQLVKRLIKRCYGCKRFHMSHYPKPSQGLLPTDRTTPNLPFSIIGTDYAGPLICKKKGNRDIKLYLLLFTCSLTRAVHLEILVNQTTHEFIQALKRLIARRGRPKVIYSDNAKTFEKAARWIKKVIKDEKVQEFLVKEEIKWKFNLSRAPWWGGQFERMVGLVKQCLYKATGKAKLTKQELEEIILDTEIILNNRPLLYIDEDIQFPVLTPNILIHGQPITIPEEQYDEEDQTMRKRQRYIKRCKDAAWRRWEREYLRSLRERHNMKNNTRDMKIAVGDVVLIKGDEKHRGKWNIGIVEELYEGKDKVIRAVRLRSRKTAIERPIQHLYPLELHCDIYKQQSVQHDQSQQLNVNAREFKPRRTAAVIADIRMNDIHNAEQLDDNI